LTNNHSPVNQLPFIVRAKESGGSSIRVNIDGGVSDGCTTTGLLPERTAKRLKVKTEAETPAEQGRHTAVIYADYPRSTTSMV
jgi:hypothetical protein